MVYIKATMTSLTLREILSFQIILISSKEQVRTILDNKRIIFTVGVGGCKGQRIRLYS